MHPRSYLFFAACSLALTSSRAAAQCTTRISSLGTVSPGGFVGGSVLSADGRYVVFPSIDPTLAAHDQNNNVDLFVHDRADGSNTCISLNAPKFKTGNGISGQPSISADGTRIAFRSRASDIVDFDFGGHADIFVSDRATGVTVLASAAAGGTAYQGNQDSHYPALSADGNFVAFESTSTNLVPPDLNSANDIFVRDLTSGALGAMSVASVSSSGVLGNADSTEASINANGRFVVYTSASTNLVAGDQNGDYDVFLRDRLAGTTVLVSVSSGGVQGNHFSGSGSISPDGARVAFISSASNLASGDTNGLTDVFVRDVAQGTTTLISRTPSGVSGNGDSFAPSFSADGRFIVFVSDASDLAPDTNTKRDVFVHDLLLGTTELVSLDVDGLQTNADCAYASISRMGRAICFTSAGPFVPAEFDQMDDSFVRERVCGIATYCTAKVNSQLCVPAIAANGAPSLGGFSDFHVTSSRGIGGAQGLLLWSLGADATPFGGGVLCLATPLVRMSSQPASGNPTVPCSGAYDFPFPQSYMASRGLLAGSTLHAQIWSRDSGLGAPNNVGLTDAVRFVIGL